MAVVYDIKAVFSKQSFAHVGVERQTNIRTNTHTFFGSNFSKPGARPQLAFG